ncbi:hypothetical protein BDB00DRAFT_863320 [Zychaea mexicana]|uniref:uncharacterized protein n=1 Tax=Zychaea mexicana TaxID=64656 RepID=UPI0022FE7F46|nr:uncharacterized protein BDB00DRAFT_863320 [Zychaea mexicana]KAI9469143.1 hypothetical protein BDB00DRAFT_863320 [Zychaea mexicana]
MESHENFGDCWKYATYSICAFEGRSFFNPTYKHFFGNMIMENACSAYGRLSPTEALVVNDAVRIALEKKAPKFLANYGPMFRAFRWIGCPLLERVNVDCGIERANITDDDGDDSSLVYARYEPRVRKWARLLSKQSPDSDAEEGAGGDEEETEQDSSNSSTEEHGVYGEDGSSSGDGQSREYSDDDDN